MTVEQYFQQHGHALDSVTRERAHATENTNSKDATQKPSDPSTSTTFVKVSE